MQAAMGVRSGIVRGERKLDVETERVLRLDQASFDAEVERGAASLRSVSDMGLESARINVLNLGAVSLAILFRQPNSHQWDCGLVGLMIQARLHAI